MNKIVRITQQDNNGGKRIWFTLPLGLYGSLITEYSGRKTLRISYGKGAGYIGGWSSYLTWKSSQIQWMRNYRGFMRVGLVNRLRWFAYTLCPLWIVPYTRNGNELGGY